MSLSLIICKIRIKKITTTTTVIRLHCGCGMKWEKEGFSLFLEGVWKPTWLGVTTPACRILLGKFEGVQDHHRHFLCRIYIRCSVDVVQTGNVRFAISRFSIPYSGYYRRTYSV